MVNLIDHFLKLPDPSFRLPYQFLLIIQYLMEVITYLLIFLQ